MRPGGIEIKHEPIDYRQIVSDTLRLMKAAADEKQISMDASLPETIPPVRGDTDKVTQVLSNLVSNAIKYTPPGGWIKVSLEVTGEASVMTCIADSGIGIASEDQKKLFQKFFRADNTSTREAGGTGLGLVIAKTIIELLGGAIWVESEAGRGSRFYYTLPLYLDTSGAGPSAHDLAGARHRPGLDRRRRCLHPQPDSARSASARLWNIGSGGRRGSLAEGAVA